MVKTIHWYEYWFKKKAKSYLEKIFLSWWIIQFIENVIKYRDIKIVTTEKRRNYLLSEPRYHTKKFFTEHLLAIKMNKPVYLWLSMLKLSKIIMHEFWYDYVKLKYGEEAKWCYMNTDSFIVLIKTDDIYKDITENFETRFDTSNYELECNSIDRSLPKGKNKKVIGLMKDESCGKVMTKFVGWRAKIYSYLIDYE